MECTIENLGQELCQPSDPFSNLAQQGIQQCQMNTLLAMYPDLDLWWEDANPCMSKDLGNGCVLLPKHDKRSIKLQGRKAQIISEYVESQKALEELCMAQNIIVSD